MAKRGSPRLCALPSRPCWRWRLRRAKKRGAAARRRCRRSTGPIIVADVETGRVIEDFDALRPWYPASTTKLMTIYVVFRAIQAGEITLDSRDPLQRAAPPPQPPSKMGFKPGTRAHARRRAEDDDGEVGERHRRGGGGDGRRQRRRFRRAHERRGAAPRHDALALRQPARAARRARRSPRRATWRSSRARCSPSSRSTATIYKLPAIQIGDKVLKNFNPLLERYPGATGMKTGFICASGYNLVASAERGERELIAVVFGEYGGKARAAARGRAARRGLCLGRDRSPSRRSRSRTSPPARPITAPLDMRPYVCGPRRAAVASEANQDGAESGRGRRGRRT